MPGGHKNSISSRGSGTYLIQVRTSLTAILYPSLLKTHHFVNHKLVIKHCLKIRCGPVRNSAYVPQPLLLIHGTLSFSFLLPKNSEFGSYTANICNPSTSLRHTILFNEIFDQHCIEKPSS